MILSLTHDHLTLGHPLAKDFRLDQGKVSFEVPYVAPNNNYLVVRAYRVPHLSLL